jgi:hypothetical protein
MPVEYLTPATEDRAVEVLTLLADRRQDRAPSVPDLIIAATAELAGLTVLHCDKDFDLIASVTGQPAEWLITPLTIQLCQSKRTLAFSSAGQAGAGGIKPVGLVAVAVGQR